MVAEVFLRKLVYAEQLLVLPLYNLTDSTSAASKTDQLKKKHQIKVARIVTRNKNRMF